jgi:predicted AAA+ superfamily ATPase
MKRNVDAQLLEWKDDPDRKILIVRGARQVGKTYSIRTLGRSFKRFIEINFEEEPAARVFFLDSLNPAKLVEKLSAFTSTPFAAGETLLFLDEIQACPQALSSLRFFHEKMPGLHVVAAGSLLELALSEIPSLGVGRLSSLFMHPLTFEEYLRAIGEEALCGIVAEADADHPVDEPFHRRLVEHVRTFQLIGGMPAVVASYVQRRDLLGCFTLLDDLAVMFLDDFAKFGKRVPVTRLSEVFRSVVLQSGGKFRYSRIASETSAPALKSALTLLVQAGLVHRVVHTHARGLPLGAQADDKKFKAILFDIGLHQRLLGLDVPRHLTAADLDLVNRGSMAESFVGQELVGNGSAHARPALYYWHREARASNAEVDYVIQQGIDIVPVEVKAATRGGMQSMRRFLDERGLSKGIRVSLENFTRYDRIWTVPLYAIRRLRTIDNGPSRS